MKTTETGSHDAQVDQLRAAAEESRAAIRRVEAEIVDTATPGRREAVRVVIYAFLAFAAFAAAGAAV